MKPAHTRITFSGHVGGSSTSITERWSFSLNSADAVAISGATEAELDAIAAGANAAYHGSLNNGMPSNCFLTSVKVASIDALGQYRQRGDGSYVLGEDNTIRTGVEAASGMPLQVALCVSLTTARSGPTGKGRFFLPWPALSLDTTTRLIPTNQMTDVVSRTKTFLGALNDLTGINLAVVSSKGYASDVTGFRIGRAPDTMRSRREDLIESYVSDTVPQ